MSVVSHPGNGKITVPELLERKTRAARLYSPPDKITCLTAYDYPTARLLDEAGVDVILVGDSVGMVALGYESTLPVTLEDMLHHARAVRRGTRRALLVADMPFGSYHTDTAEAAEHLLRDARAVEAAGAFAVVLEALPRELAAEITRELRIPTIGIGAGPDCDGQVLVLHDILGLAFTPLPKFARRYAQLGEMISGAVRQYCQEVRSGGFPSDAESYHAPRLAKEEKEAPVNIDGDW
jgi:3-methyl-2-oxobutanoate hydroxymethyltransferase